MLSAALLFVRALQIVPPQFEGIPKSEGGASDRKGPAMALNSQSLNIRLLYKIATFFYGTALSFLLCLEGLCLFLFCDIKAPCSKLRGISQKLFVASEPERVGMAAKPGTQPAYFTSVFHR
jgi:hypothetical protein